MSQHQRKKVNGVISASTAMEQDSNENGAQ
jgi:hypothetical protein